MKKPISTGIKLQPHFVFIAKKKRSFSICHLANSYYMHVEIKYFGIARKYKHSGRDCICDEVTFHGDSKNIDLGNNGVTQASFCDNFEGDFV